jgi:hypothetical protein
MNKIAARKRLAQIRLTVASLDRLANYIQANAKRHGISRKASHDLCLRMDRVSDLLDTVSNDFVDEDWEDEIDFLPMPEEGSMSQEYQDDEPYMDTYDAPTGVMEAEDDEPYMDWFNNNDNEEVQEYVEENGRPGRVSSRAPGRRRRVEADVSNWRFRWADEGAEDEDKDAEEEMTEEEKEAGMRWARRQRQARLQQQARQRQNRR